MTDVIKAVDTRVNGLTRKKFPLWKKTFETASRQSMTSPDCERKATRRLTNRALKSMSWIKNWESYVNRRDELVGELQHMIMRDEIAECPRVEKHKV